ncbi:hypothetical protein Tco_0261069 [Tanacetum coccineum]
MQNQFMMLSSSVSGQAKHDTNAHDQSLHDFESLIIEVQVEAEKQRQMNIELKKQKALLQRELETCKELVKEFENKPEQPLGYKEAYEEFSEKLGLPSKKMANESKLLKLFVYLDNEIKELGKLIDDSLQMEKERTSLRQCLMDIKQELTEEVQEMLETFMLMEQKVEVQAQKDKPFQNEIDQLLEASLEREIRDYVLISVAQQKNEMLMCEMEKISNESKDIQENLTKRIKILENDFQRSQAQSIDFELKLKHQKEQTSCDISWKLQMAQLNGEDVSLNIQIESFVQENERIKFEF